MLDGKPGFGPEAEKLKVLSAIKNLKPGETHIYHQGFLCADIEDHSREIRNIAIGRQEGAYSAYEKGWCLLVQKKVADGFYEYLAVRTR